MWHRVRERRGTNCHTMLPPRAVKDSRGVLGGCTFLVDEMDVPKCVTSLLGTKTSGAQIQMSAILIRCRKTSRVVPTGLTTENVKFVSLAGIQFSMVCPVCGGIHRWKQRDAWVEGSDQPKRRQNRRGQAGKKLPRTEEVKQRTGT